MKWTLPTYFRAPTPMELAAAELIEARRAKLAADSAVEYASAMSEYHAARIERLQLYIAGSMK